MGIFYHFLGNLPQINFTSPLHVWGCYKKSRIVQLEVLFHLHNLPASCISWKHLRNHIFCIHTVPLMYGQPTPSDSSHLGLGFIFCARMSTTNPSKPSASTGPDVEEVLEVDSELEEVSPHAGHKERQRKSIRIREALESNQKVLEFPKTCQASTSITLQIG